MGKNIKNLAGTVTFDKRTVDQMNGLNKNNKEIPSPIYIPTKRKKK